MGVLAVFVLTMTLVPYVEAVLPSECGFALNVCCRSRDSAQWVDSVPKMEATLHSACDCGDTHQIPYLDKSPLKEALR